MKKKFILPTLFSMFIFFSCSSKTSFEQDVRKMAGYRCEMQKLMAMDPDDKTAQEKAKELRKKMEDYSEKMAEKYKDKLDDKDMDKEADKIMEEVMKNCK